MFDLAVTLTWHLGLQNVINQFICRLNTSSAKVWRKSVFCVIVLTGRMNGRTDGRTHSRTDKTRKHNAFQHLSLAGGGRKAMKQINYIPVETTYRCKAFDSFAAESLNETSYASRLYLDGLSPNFGWRRTCIQATDELINYVLICQGFTSMNLIH